MSLIKPVTSWHNVPSFTPIQNYRWNYSYIYFFVRQGREWKRHSEMFQSLICSWFICECNLDLLLFFPYIWNRSIIFWKDLLAVFMLLFTLHSGDEIPRCFLCYLGFESRQGLGIFLITPSSRPVLGPTSYRGALSLGVKGSGREADHSPPSSAEVTNAWSCISTPSIRLHGVVLS